MPRRNYDYKEDCSSSDEDEPPKKRSSNNVANSTHFEEGDLITDIRGTSWKLGKTIGIGGFGEIYEAYENNGKGKTDNSYVAKVEKYMSGPLFVEINCYLRIAKSEMIEDWKRKNKMKFLGMPHYIASGSCYHDDEKYRFLLLPKYTKDLGEILQEKKLFNIKTVSNICIQILDVLEYIHTKGYIHSDIKASNIMIGNQTKLKTLSKPVCNRSSRTKAQRPVRSTSRPVRISKRNLRPCSAINYCEDIDYFEYWNDMILPTTEIEETIENETPNQVYLVDYGLASRFLMSNGNNKEFSVDERKAHAGTVLFCSRDAHQGIPSRRSDLESLAYNMIWWLTGTLPWIDDIEQPEEVKKKKNRCFKNLKDFLNLCFTNDFPNFVLEYFQYLDKLQFKEDPDYEYCRNIFKKAIKLYGYKGNSDLDFDNLEGFGKQKKLKPAGTKTNKKLTYLSFLKSSPLMPLHSNIVFKRPKLRKKIKNHEVQDSMMNWSKILVDPETIIKQARERKTTEDSDSDITCLDIHSMNPTEAMLEVYYGTHKNGDPSVNIEGFTQAMMSVYQKIIEREKHENTQLNAQRNGTGKRKSRKGAKRSESPVDRSSRSRSQTGQKKDNSQAIQLKKLRNTTFKRSYRLRG